MVRLVTFESHPSTIKLVRAETPFDALEAAHDFLPGGESDLQGIVWVRDDVQDGSSTVPVSELTKEFQFLGDNKYACTREHYGAGNTSQGTSIVSDTAVVALQDSSFLMKYLCDAHKLNLNVDVVTFNQQGDLRLRPHFDARKCLTSESDSENRSFMRSKKLRSVWTDVSPENLSAQTGTLLWTPEDINNEEFHRALEDHDIRQAESIACSDLELSPDSAWQIRNGDVLMMPMGGHWGAFKYLLHSMFPQNTSDSDFSPRTVHRLDVSCG